MRKALLAVVLCLTPVLAADLSEADRRALTDHLQQSSQEFLASVEGLTEAQWKFKASPERWSIAECAEHIALSEDFIRDMIEQKVLAGEVSPSSGDTKELDQKVVQMVTDRSFKAQAPEPLVPSNRFSAPADILKHFEQSRQKTLALATSRKDLRDHSAPGPGGGNFDAYQWTLFLSGHTLRHTAQINEVKAAAGFPK
jgi:hypothetical protein